MSFDTLGLSAELLRAVSEKGYSEPTPIQSQAIPVILQGRDLMAGAQTGTGKTAGFTLPLLQRLHNPEQANSKSYRAPRALILTPTRELAAQVADSVSIYGKHLPLRSAVVFGGVNIRPQMDKLRRGCDILIATPGRLLDHANQRTVDLSKVEILVLDEADRMLDMGFIIDIRKIIGMLPTERQNLMFSATFSDEIKVLADGILRQPEFIKVAPRNNTTELISQIIHPVDQKRKRELLSHLIGAQNWKQVLVFTRTKHGANRLSEQLEEDGIRSTAIHSNKSQSARTQALASFKKGMVQVLVATDIAARGLDIDQLPHVVNFDLPNVPEDYVHRIGRTGRAGNVGEAISLVSVDEHKLLREIERLLKRDLPRVQIPGYTPDPSIRAMPIANGRNRSRPTENRYERRPSGERSNGENRSRSRSSEGRSEGRRSSFADNSEQRRAGGGFTGNSEQGSSGYAGNREQRRSAGAGYAGNGEQRRSAGANGEQRRSAGAGYAGNGEQRRSTGAGYAGNGEQRRSAGAGYAGNGEQRRSSGAGYAGNGEQRRSAGAGYAGNGEQRRSAGAGYAGNGEQRRSAGAGYAGNGEQRRSSGAGYAGSSHSGEGYAGKSGFAKPQAASPRPSKRAWSATAAPAQPNHGGGKSRRTESW
jgi:ATP-dependent RNA helicase RhlE